MKNHRLLLALLLHHAVAAQDSGSNPEVALSSCQSLSCTPPDGSVCASEGFAGPKPGVGIAPKAVNSSSSGMLSFTLVEGLEENGFTGVGSEAYEHWDQQLFVGTDPEEDDGPDGCVLMMQYQGQPFPREQLPDEDARSARADNTTSCDGVLDAPCRASIVDMVQSANASGDGRCDRLVERVNSELRSNQGTCGGEGTWIANFFNVTGGRLPGSEARADSSDRLGSDECMPVLPASYELRKVAELRQMYFAEPPEGAAGFLGGIYGGHDGWTPVATVVYGDDGESSPDVSFLCMKTRERDGSQRESALGGDSMASSMVASLPLVISSCVASIIALL